MFGLTTNQDIAHALPELRKMVAGDFNVRISRISGNGETAELLHLINDLVDRCDAYVRESAACMHYVSENQYYRKIIETSMQGDFLTAARRVNSALGVDGIPGREIRRCDRRIRVFRR